MYFYLIVGLAAIIILDAKVLRPQNEALYDKSFSLSNRTVILVALLIALLLHLSQNKDTEVPALLLICILSFYLIQRLRFVRHLRNERPSRDLLLSDALSVIVGWTFSMLVIGLVVQGVISPLFSIESELVELILSVILWSSVLFILVYHASSKFSDKDFLTNVRLRRFGQPWVKWALVPAVIGGFFAYTSAFIIMTRKIQPQTPLGDILETTQSSGLILVFLALALLFAPLFEEIVFRGYFFHVLQKVKGSAFAVVFVALSFGLLHVGQYWGDWMAIGMVMIIGFALTLLRFWSKTTLSSVVMHYVYNIGVTIIPIIMLVSANPAFFKYQAFYKQLDFQTKEALLLESIEKDPELAIAYNDLAWAYFEENVRLPEALRLVDRALELEPEVPAYIDTKVEVLKALGRMEESEIWRKRLEEVEGN